MKLTFLSFLFYWALLMQQVNPDSSRLREDEININLMGETQYQMIYLIEQGDKITFKGECFGFGVYYHPESEEPWSLRDHDIDFNINGQERPAVLQHDTDGDGYLEKIELDVTVTGPALVMIWYIPLDFRNTA